MIVSPSVLSGHFGYLKTDLEQLENGSCEWIHYDVMDGHFVPNISFGPGILKNVREITKKVLDVHLMISDPLFYLDEFIKNGSDMVTFHIEAYDDPSKISEVITRLHAAGLKAGLSIKPATPVSALAPYLADLDLVLVMSVEPGFGGQSFMDSCLPKISELKTLREANNYHYLIEVDGGINDKTAKLVKDAGVDAVVAGSYVFKAQDREAAVNSLR